MKTTVEYGVKHPNGSIERIRESDANEGYMTGAEYAAIRARVTGGTVVKRTRVVTLSDWEAA